MLLLNVLLLFYLFGRHEAKEPLKNISPPVNNNCVALMHNISDKANAKCLDGSNPLYYTRGGTDKGTSKWIVFFEGWGWCFDSESCYKRSKSPQGSSKGEYGCSSTVWPKYLSPNVKENPLMYNWNVVYVRYCDGGSFAGNSKGYHVDKGRNIADEIIKDLLQKHGMVFATDIVIAGESAGGLGVLLGIDAMSYTIRKAVEVNHMQRVNFFDKNNLPAISGLVVSGMFYDFLTHSSMKHVADSGKVSDGIVIPPDVNNGQSLVVQSHQTAGMTVSQPRWFNNQMRGLYRFMGIRGNIACVQNFTRTHRRSADCLFGPYAIPFIKTPLFVIQSQYDTWNLRNILLIDNTSDKEVVGNHVNLMGNFLKTALTEALFGKDTVQRLHGLHFDGCSFHGLNCMNSYSNTSFSLWRGNLIEGSYSNWYIAFSKFHMSKRQVTPPKRSQKKLKDTAEVTSIAGRDKYHRVMKERSWYEFFFGTRLPAAQSPESSPLSTAFVDVDPPSDIKKVSIAPTSNWNSHLYRTVNSLPYPCKGCCPCSTFL